MDFRVAGDSGAGEADGGDLGGVLEGDSVFGVDPRGPGAFFALERDGEGFDASTVALWRLRIRA